VFTFTNEFEAQAAQTDVFNKFTTFAKIFGDLICQFLAYMNKLKFLHGHYSMLRLDYK